MSNKRIQDVWLGEDDRWRPWVKQALFASMGREDARDLVQAKEGDVYRSETPPWAGRDVSWLGRGKVAFIVDLPGPEAIEMGLVLGQRGFRPVLSINATSSSDEVIPMEPVLRRLAMGARFQSSFPSGLDAPPAFLLDARRDGDGAAIGPGWFDNRWTVFASDLPPAEGLKAAGIATVVIVQEGTDVTDDVRAIGRAYQRAGMDVRIANTRDESVVAMAGDDEGWLRFTIGQLRRRFSLRRSWDGSYGHRVPIPPLPSHG